mmetsp:Transcript_111198/g.192797  ORF Transcript_111198/g.192797 Transcript_111198/m.192797 type:complete len:372 (+) Transcript_111198:96-1211(+)
MTGKVQELEEDRCESWPTSYSLTKIVSVAAICGIFMVTGPTLVMLNKYIMQGLGFDYPLSLSCLGLLTSAVCIRCAVCLGFATVRAESLDVVSGRDWFRIALPIALCKAVTLAAGNAAYLHLGLGFIQMLKAFTPVVVLVVGKLLRVAQPSTTAVRFVFVIVAGTLIEVRGKMDASLIGLALMLTSEVMEAMNWVMTQKLLQNSKFTIVESLYVLAPPGAACLLLAAVIFEWPRLLRRGDLQKVADAPLYFAIAALVGFAVNFIGFLVVQATSTLTMKILNTARGIGLVMVGMLIYRETYALQQSIGYAVALVGFIGYNYAQLFPESDAPSQQVAPRRHASATTSYGAKDPWEAQDLGKSSAEAGEPKPTI